MKKVSGKMAVVLAAAVLACSSCSTWSNTGKGAAIGAGSGVAAGAGLGAIIGGGKGAVIGAAVGGVVGTAAGAAIGKKMDRQAAELESQLGDEARVETVTDQNNLQAIRVTFDSGILFDTGKSELSSSARASLAKFAASVRNNPQTDITVYGVRSMSAFPWSALRPWPTIWWDKGSPATVSRPKGWHTTLPLPTIPRRKAARPIAGWRFTSRPARI